MLQCTITCNTITRHPHVTPIPTYMLRGCETKLTIASWHTIRQESETTFHLRSWVSNSSQLYSTHQENTACSTVLANVIDVILTLTSHHSYQDHYFGCYQPDYQMIQGSSKVLDLLGLAVPVTISVKLSIQTLWQK